ncbi:MAG: hypothetical protein KJ709_06165 [Nanoarchaeota archaeon]|nr:hypothetical protein [Nanoarchaeota archaeon]
MRAGSKRINYVDSENLKYAMSIDDIMKLWPRRSKKNQDVIRYQTARRRRAILGTNDQDGFSFEEWAFVTGGPEEFKSRLLKISPFEIFCGMFNTPPFRARFSIPNTRL